MKLHANTPVPLPCTGVFARPGYRPPPPLSPPVVDMAHLLDQDDPMKQDDIMLLIGL
jgi:hypothetical protein